MTIGDRRHNRTARPLQPVERALFSYVARHPRVNATIGAVTLFKGAAPSIDQIRDELRQKLPLAPRMNCSLTFRGPRPATWSPVEHLDLDQLIEERTLPDSGDAGLRDVIDQLINERLDLTRPLWRVWLLHGYAQDEFAVLYLGHHALHDGFSISRKVAVPLMGSGMQKDPVRAPQRDSTATPPSISSAVRGAVNVARGFLPPSARLDAAGLTGERRLTWAFTDHSLLSSIARRHGTTVNVVYVAALTAVLREWPDSPWHQLRKRNRQMWAFVPMSTWKESDDLELGNRVIPFRVRLPCEEQDPLTRLTQLAVSTSRGKRDGRVAAERSLGSTMHDWPAQILTELFYSTRYAHLAATNVPGPTQDLQLCGRPVTGFAPVSFLPGRHQMGSALTTYQGRTCVAFLTDTGSSQSDDLPQRWLQAVQELSLV
jgi:diacylglycerol O-acyltransferase / wax synthase